MNGTCIVLIGWPASGKTRIARELSERLKIPYYEVNDIRRAYIAASSERERSLASDRRKAENLAAYRILCFIIEENLLLGNSVITTATFTRLDQREMFTELHNKFPAGIFKFIECIPSNDTREAIEGRLRNRVAFEGYPRDAGIHTYEEYLTCKGWYLELGAPEISYITIDTSSFDTLDVCFREAIEYVNA